MAGKNLKVGAIKDVSGEVNIAAGDIIKNIKTIHQRALTAAEAAAHARKLESKLLAQGIATLVQNLSAQASEGTESDSPYKGLLPYSLNEAEIFYGRNKAKKDLLVHIKQSPLTVLHAESGAGKSSLLQAGIAAQLIANGHLAVYLRPYHADPVQFIKRMFLPELTQAPALAGGSLRDFLRQVCSVLGAKSSLYLLLDQFEEFFQLKKEERQPFLDSLADCLNDPSLNVRWVLALRKEALSDLAELESFGITQFKNTYRLNRLSRGEAQEAMIEPASRYDIAFEPALTEHILDTLTTNDEVRPTHLQLVCSALTDDLPEEKTLTLAYYTEQEGGTEGILRDYLKRQLEDLPASEQTLAWKVLRALISADRQRALKTYDQLIQELKTSGVSKKQIETILSRLMERRLLFTQTQSATEEMFELAHDYLIKEIELDPQEQALKAAQELLDQETRTYQRHKTLLSAERLAVIEPYQNELQFSADAEILLSESRKAVRQEQLVRDRRRNLILASSFAIAIAMSLLALWGFRSSQNAKYQAGIALARQLRAQSQSLDLDNGTTAIQSGLLAVEAGIRGAGSGTDQVLHRYLALTSFPIASMTHDDAVWSLAFSPNGKFIVSASGDGTARVWEANTGQEVARITHDGSVQSVSFSPDSRWVASGACVKRDLSNNCIQGIARISEAATGKEIASMNHDGRVESVAFSPDDKYVVSGSGDGIAQVWEAATGKEVARMTHDDYVNVVSFSSNGKYVVSGSGDNTARLWEATTGKEIARMTHDDTVWAVAFSPDDNYVASGSSDGTTRVWEANTGQEVARMTYEEPVFSIAFSPEGKYIVSGSLGGLACVWEVTSGNEISCMTHDYWVNTVVFSPDGKYVVSASDDGTARVWEANTGQEVARMTHDLFVHSAAFSPDGKYVVSGDADGTILVWKVINGKNIAHMNHDDWVFSVASSPNGKYVASGGRDSTARVWDVNTGEEIARMTHDNSVSYLSFSPDGKYIVSGSYDNIVRVWEVSTSKEITLMSHDDGVQSVAFSPDGEYIVSGSYDNTVRIWEVGTGKEIVRMTHDDWVNSVAFSPDGKYVVSGSDDNTVRIWEVNTGEEILRMIHEFYVKSVDFSPDGKYVVSGSHDNTIRLWEASTGKEIRRMVHDYFVESVAFSSDGNYIASGGDDRTIRVWEANTGEEIARILYDGEVYSVAFSPDGKYIVSGGDGGVAQVGYWQIEDLMAEACKHLPRNLTRAEWVEYIGNEPYRATCTNLPIEQDATAAPGSTP